MNAGKHPRQLNPAKHVAEVRKYKLKQYGLTPEKYTQMVKAQNGKCAVCKLPRPDDKSLMVDHDHDTNTVRGLLCYNCNMALGLLHDSLENIQELHRYLAAHKGRVIESQ